MNTHAQIDDVIKANKIYRFESELANTSNKDRIEMIRKILDNIKAVKNSETIKVENMSNYVKILKESQYKKKWHVLNLDQKLDRLNMYLTELNITDAKLKTKIINYLKTGEIKTKDIKYDVNVGKIIEIELLVKTDEGYKIDIKPKTVRKEIKEVKEDIKLKSKTSKKE